MGRWKAWHPEKLHGFNQPPGARLGFWTERIQSFSQTLLEIGAGLLSPTSASDGRPSRH